MNMNRFGLLVLSCLLAAISWTQPGDFKRGLEAVADSNYSKAIELFSKDFEADPSVASTFNLGVVYLRSKDYERALFAFERGLMLAPDAEDLQANARYTFRELHPDQTWVHPVPGMIRFLHVLPFYGWFSLAIVFSLITAIFVYVLLTYRKKSSAHQWSRRLIIPAGCLLLIMLAALITLSSFHDRHHYGFVTTEQPLYLHPDGMESAVQIPQGAVEMIQYNADSSWAKVRYSDHQGWMESDALKPY